MRFLGSEDDDETDEEIDRRRRKKQPSTTATNEPLSSDEGSDQQEESEHETETAQQSGPTKKTTPRQPMHKDEPKNFLYLAAALSIFLATEIEVEQIDLGQRYLERYLDGYYRVRPSSLPLFVALLIAPLTSSMGQKQLCRITTLLCTLATRYETMGQSTRSGASLASVSTRY